MRREAALILGGGPAGSAAAIALATGGVRATILERTRATGDALCGGFLSWQTLAALTRLGIAADDLNPAAITRLRIFAGKQVAETPLPAPARAVSRARLDRLLRDRAAALGARIECGVTVRALTRGTAQLSDGGAVTGDAVILATGKHDLRGAPRAAPGADPAIGLRVRVPAIAQIDDAIELHLFDGGYAGLVVQEDGRANLCLAIARSRLRAAGDPASLLGRLAADHPALARRLDRFDPAAPIDAVANVPYGWRATAGADGAYRVGDQAAVIPSLAGEGMGIAVASGVAAARAILSGTDADRFQRGFARQAHRPLAIAGLIRAAAEHPHIAALIGLAGRSTSLVHLVAGLTRINQPAIDECRAPPHIMGDGSR